MTQLGYAPASVRLQMKVLADLSDWLLSHGMAAADLRRSDLDRFLRHRRRAAGHTRYASIRALRPVLDYLQRFEVVPRQAPHAVLGPVDVMLDQFWRYLTVERALAAVTARAYLDMVRPFVQGRLSADCRALELERLTAADIISFVVTCPRQSRGAAKLTVTALRSFLRFLHLDGIIEESLDSAVPSVAGRRLVGLPKGLAPDQVRRLFASCNDTTQRGCRDIAILTMLVRLGMRSGEVAKLRLDDIDWRAGEIIVRGKANSIERIPLPQTSAAPWPSISSVAVRSAPKGGQYLSESKLLIATSVPAASATWWPMPPSGPASGESMRTGSGTRPRCRCCGLGRRCRRSANSCVTAVL